MKRGTLNAVNKSGAGSVPELGVIPLERNFTPQQVAQHLCIDVSTARRLFIDRPGVLLIGRPTARGDKRSYCTLRIPLSVLEKFMTERTR